MRPMHQWGRTADVGRSLTGDPVMADLLPSESDDVREEQVWRRWQVLALGRPELASVLEAGRLAELQAVERRTGGSPELVESRHLVLTAIISRMVDEQDPWSLERARQCLERLDDDPSARRAA